MLIFNYSSQNCHSQSVKIKRVPTLIYSSLLACLMILFLGSTGCTVFRDGEGGRRGEQGGNMGGGGGGGMMEELDPIEVDLLVLATFDKSPISESYSLIIDHLIAQLTLRNVITNKVGIAPMYRRINETVPLLFGSNAEDRPFDTYNDMLSFYTSEEGLNLIDTFSENDGANLIRLGARLGNTPLYHPQDNSIQGDYYFEEARDGLIVVWLNADARQCTLSECETDEGDSVAQVLTETDENGNAAWLNLGGMQRLPAKKVFHLFVGTEETTDEDDFADSCEDRLGFDPSLLDFIAHSNIPLYSQLADRLDQANLPNDDVDFCKALSAEGIASFLLVANSIRGALIP